MNDLVPLCSERNASNLKTKVPVQSDMWYQFKAVLSMLCVHAGKLTKSEIILKLSKTTKNTRSLSALLMDTVVPHAIKTKIKPKKFYFYLLSSKLF